MDFNNTLTTLKKNIKKEYKKIKNMKITPIYTFIILLL